MRIAYETWNPGAEARATVARAVDICTTYRQQGYDLTLRQLYYQFVARDLLPNNQKSYDKLGSIVNRARLAGLMDWEFIVDRTRNLRSLGHFDNPADVVRAAEHSFRLDRWETQPVRVEVWVEKEALAGVVQRVAQRLDVPWFSCRGYVSQSELWGAAQRVGSYLRAGQRVVILHLGDHDPSGIDMTRDITERMAMFTNRDWIADHHDEWDLFYLDEDEVPDPEYPERDDVLDSMRECVGDTIHEPVEVRRIALNRDQVTQYDPPPNPAKLTDSRATGYIAEHGRQSWELDALEPSVLDALIEQHVRRELDPEPWQRVEDREREQRVLLTSAADNWTEVAEYLRHRAV